jgi:HD-GYP domain-containing protein (c-di-GMP phosphodiesterase class II)
VTARETQSSFGRDHAPLAQRFREAGIVLVQCDVAGVIAAPPVAEPDWLVGLFLRAPLFGQLLRTEVEMWGPDGLDRPREITPGVWIVATALTERRRLAGYSIALIVTEALLDNDMLRGMCQGASQDFEMTRRLLAQLPPAAEIDVPRLARMVEFALEDAARLTADAAAMESVGQQLSESYEEMNLLYTIIQSMTVVERPHRFVSLACEELLATLSYAWVGMRFVDDQPRLQRLSGRFICTGRLTSSREDISRSLQELLPYVEPETGIVVDPRSNPEHAGLGALGRNGLVHPITSDGHLLGLLVAGNKEGDDRSASSVDMKLIGATASHTAIFLENAALYDDLNAMFLGTLEALTASIDAKDRYTCGHSQRVAHLTQQLARAVGLDEKTVSRTRIAGLVHDVGKIGVPEAVLLKPGRLNEEEFDWIRRHPEMGYRILRDIPQLTDILPGVLHHHERWDGDGYPSGLAGEDIPLIARLITLADAFDAMSSSRTYRTCMSRRDVLAEIMECAGTQFDPSLAPIFVSLDFGEYDRLVEEHQAIELDPQEDAA